MHFLGHWFDQLPDAQCDFVNFVTKKLEDYFDPLKIKNRVSNALGKSLQWIKIELASYETRWFQKYAQSSVIILLFIK